MANSNRFTINNVYWNVDADGTSVGWSGTPVAGSTRHFLDAPMTTTADTSVTLKIAAESFAGYQDRIVPDVRHVGRDETKTCALGTPLVYPGTNGLTNAVAPYEVTFDLDLGENEFELSYICSDNVTVVTKTHHVYRKAILATTNVSTKADLVAAIGQALRSANGAGTDIITVTSPLVFSWGEFAEVNGTLTGNDVVPNSSTRDYPPVIDGNNNLTFKMDFQTYLIANGRAAADARGGFTNFPLENLICANMHFKNTDFGVDDTNNPLTATLSYSDSTNVSGRTPCFTLENCNVYGSQQRGVEDAGDSSPVASDAFRNRYPDTKMARYPDLDWWAPITSSNTAVISTTSGTVDFSGTAIRNASTGSGLDSMTMEENAGTYTLKLVFYSDVDARIFKSLAKWTGEHNYGPDLFSVIKNGESTPVGYTATSQIFNDDFTAEIITGGGTNEIWLEGPRVQNIGAKMWNSNASFTFEVIMRSAQFPSSLARCIQDDVSEGVVSRRQRTSFLNTTLTGCCFQGGMVNAERMVGVYYKQNRGDIGHMASCVFNMALESGDVLLSADFFDTTHADIVQIFNMYDREGRLYQNVYKGDDGGIWDGDTTIPFILDRTNITRHEGIVIDNFYEDPTSYTWNGSEIVGGQPIKSTFCGLQRNVRLSNLQCYGSSMAFRWDYNNGGAVDSTTLDTTTYGSTNLHNINFYQIGYLPLTQGTGAELDNITVDHTTGQAGLDLGEVNSYLTDPAVVGTNRSTPIWTGTNTLFDPNA